MAQLVVANITITTAANTVEVQTPGTVRIVTVGTTGYSGFSGKSGYSGPSGYSGFSGKSGFSGANPGASGYSGFSGKSGFSGANPGASGYSGFSGRSGYSGFSGTGTSGYSGYSGVSGYSGYSGPSGYSGYSGPSGYSGFTGVSGYSGFSGTSGYSGFSGVSGYSGFSGISGYSGFSGPSGYSGYSGISGYSGYSGYSGFSGGSGYSGYSGGGGNVTAGGTLTSTALVTGAGTTAIQTPSATSTLDSSGNVAIPGTFIQTSASATAFQSGPNGGTNPVLRIVNSTASQADGISITGLAAGAGTTFTALSSGSNAGFNFTTKGTGVFTLSAAASTNALIVQQGSADIATLSTNLGLVVVNGRHALWYDGGSFAVPGNLKVEVRNAAGGGLWLASDGIVGFFSATSISGSPDTHLTRDAAGVLKAGTTAANALGALLGGRVVLAKTANYPIVAATDNSKFFTNAGASAQVDFTLPTAVPGLQFSFYVDAAQTLKVIAGASTTIRIAAAVSAAAGNITNATVGGCVTLVAISATQWVAECNEGTWVVT